MSYELTAKILRRYLPGVSGIDKAVLATLADMIGDKGYCFPSYATLASRTGFSKRTVIRSVESLYDLGLISKEQTKNKANKYRVIQEKLDQLIKKGKNILKASASVSPQGSLSDTSTGDLETPQGYLSDTLINKGKNKKEKIKNGATSPKIAKASPKVEEKVGEEKQKTKNVAYGFEDFFDEMEKIESTPLPIVENPALEDGQVIIGTDFGALEGAALILAEKGGVDVEHEGKIISMQSSGPIKIKPQAELLPVNPKEGQLMVDEQANVFAYHDGWWKPATHEEKANMKVEDVLQMPIQKQAKKKTIKPTAAMVWQWSVSEWYSEKKNQGKAINLTLTQKKKGQLNTAAKKINQSGYEWRPLIEFTVKHWMDFTTFVTKATGKQNYPAVPDIDYFLFHVNHVIGFWNKDNDTSIKKKPKIKITKDKLTEKELKKLTPVEKYNLEHGD